MTVSVSDQISQAVDAGRQALAFDQALTVRLIDMAGAFAVNLTIAILIFAATLFAAKWGAAVVRRMLGRTRAFRHDQTVVAFAVQVVRVVIIIIGLIAVLQRLGVQTTSIIAVLGAASLAVGLALQGTLSNVAAGVMLLVLRPYRVGDIVDIGGATCVVDSAKPRWLEARMTAADDDSAAMPCGELISTRPLPRVRMMRHPPM